MLEKHFSCSKCGACCRHLEAFNGLYSDLDNGYGVCKFYNTKTKLCDIYSTRPEKCRIDESYSRYKDIISLDEYHRLTYEGCLFLRTLDLTCVKE